MKSRFGIATALAVVTALFLTATASASEPLEDGAYSVVLPDGETAITFTISNDGDTVEMGELPTGFTEDETSEGTTKISNTDNSVTVEIQTGDDGKIEVHGSAFAGSDTVIATLPNVGLVVVSLDGEIIELPGDFKVEDMDSEGDELEIRISDGQRTFEIEIDLEDGSVEIERQDDDSSSEDDNSDDSDSDDDTSDDESTEDTVLDDSRSDDEESDDDDDSSADVTESTVDPNAETTPTTADVTDDDDSSDDQDDDSDDDSDDEAPAQRSNDDDSDDDDSSD